MCTILISLAKFKEKIMQQITKKNRYMDTVFYQKEAGFSLVELIIVLGIMGLIIVVAMTYFNDWGNNYRLKGEARDLYSNMQKAKIGAIKSNTTVTLNFTASTGSPCQGGSYTFTDGGGVNIVSSSITNGICLSTPSSFPNGFSAKGLASGATGTIELTHPDRLIPR